MLEYIITRPSHPQSQQSRERIKREPRGLSICLPASLPPRNDELQALAGLRKACPSPLDVMIIPAFDARALRDRQVAVACLFIGREGKKARSVMIAFGRRRVRSRFSLRALILPVSRTI